MRELKNEEMNAVSGGTDGVGNVSSPDGVTTTVYCTRAFLRRQVELATGYSDGGGSGNGSAFPIGTATTLLDGLSGNAVSSGQAAANIINDLTGAEEDAPFIVDRGQFADFFVPELDDELREAYIDGPN